MQVIYIDVLFALNLTINYLLLFLTSRFSGVYTGRLRLLGGAALGALFSVLMFFPKLPELPSVLFKCLLCAAVTAVAFGKKSEGRMLRLCFIFCSVSFALAGVVMALSMLTGEQFVVLRNGVPYLKISVKLLLLSSAAAYGILGAVFGSGGMRIAKSTVETEICLQGKCLKLRALIDSGNLLRDPMTGKRILVVGAGMLAELFDGPAAEILKGCGRDNAAECFTRLSDIHPGIFALTPYHDVSSGVKLMLVIKPDGLSIDGKEHNDVLVGAAAQPVETPDGCMAILGV